MCVCVPEFRCPTPKICSVNESAAAEKSAGHISKFRLVWKYNKKHIILWRSRLPPRSTIRPGTLDSDRQRPRAVQVASFAAKTASRTCSAAENETVWKEQTRFRSNPDRPQNRARDITDTCAASSSGRNRTVRADLSSKPPWPPPCNRQPSYIIIIVCNIFQI